MQAGLNTVIIIVIAGVLLVLFAGLINMFRGGSPNLSQNLMRARVGLQLLAVVLLLAAFYFFGPGRA